MISFSLPTDYPRIRRVQNFQELATTPFANGVNALCWERTLPGDFVEVATQLGGNEAITTLNEADLEGLAISAAGRTAIQVMLDDQRRLQARSLDPVLKDIIQID